MVTEGSDVHCLSLAAECDLRTKLGTLQHSRNGSSWNRFTACLEQFKGLVEALHFLHNTESDGENTCYCHMDIKPENIVVFETDPRDPVGRWKLIDFGISTIRDKRRFETEGGDRDRTRGQHVTYTVGTTPKSMRSRYQPPEINSQLDNSPENINMLVGRGSDVWALGCVFAEVVAANLRNLNELSRDDTRERGKPMNEFYEENRIPRWSKYKRHRSFERWLKDLKRHYNFHPGIEPCRDLIIGMTRISKIKRPSSEQVLRRLNEFFRT